jgi:DNA-directed RNA polymerase subunit RPC12/RpoP
MASKETVSCPNCGSTSTYNVGVSNGSTGVQCKQCRTSFRIYMKQGNVDQVK